MNVVIGGAALAVLTAVSISVTNVASRLHFEAGSNPTTFLFWRYLLFSVALVLLLMMTGRGLKVAGRGPDLAVAGLLNVLGAGSLAFAIERIPVALAVTILYLFPCITVVGDALIARRRPGLVMLAAVLLALAGLALAVGLGADAAAQPDPVGLAYALTAAFGIAGSLMWSERRLHDLHAATRLYGLTLVGLVAVIGLCGVRGDLLWPFATLARGVTLLIATAGFMIAMSALFVAVSRIGAGRTAILMNLEPPVTVVFAALVLNETLSTTQLAGVAIVLVAILLAQWSGSRAAEGGS